MTTQHVTIEQHLEVRFVTILHTAQGEREMPHVALSTLLSEDAIATLPEALSARLTRYTQEAQRLAGRLVRDAAALYAEGGE